MDDAIKRLDDLVMLYGKIVTEVNKDIKMLRQAETTFGMKTKDVKKMTTALVTTSSYYIKKQEIVALEAEQMKEV